VFLETKKIHTLYKRSSKLGVEHCYTRTKTLVVFRCDNCSTVFERDLGKMDHKRLSNIYFHVCSNCNAKQFAQRKGVEKRKFWDLSVDNDIDITRL
jgi:hypothetical protein